MLYRFLVQGQCDSNAKRTRTKSQLALVGIRIEFERLQTQVKFHCGCAVDLPSVEEFQTRSNPQFKREICERI